MTRMLRTAIGTLCLIAPVAAYPQGGSLGFTANSTLAEVLEHNGTPFAWDWNPWDYDILATAVLGLGNDVEPTLFRPGILSTVPVNGDFETGELSPWTTVTQDPADFPIQVISDGFVTPLGVIGPIGGEYSCVTDWNSGSDLNFIRLRQLVDVPPSASELRFRYRAAWDLTAPGASFSRGFMAVAYPSAGGPPLIESEILVIEPGTAGDTGVQEGHVPFTSVAGQSVLLEFYWSVLETDTGPAWFLLDDVRFTRRLRPMLDGLGFDSTLLAPNDAAFIRLAWSLGAPVWNEAMAVDAILPLLADIGYGDVPTGWQRLALNHLVLGRTHPLTWFTMPSVPTFEGPGFIADPHTITLVDGVPELPDARPVQPFLVGTLNGSWHTLSRPLLPHIVH